jgi:hypothetical protein
MHGDSDRRPGHFGLQAIAEVLKMKKPRNQLRMQGFSSDFGAQERTRTSTSCNTGT